MNSVLYLFDEYYADPNGNLHELDRAIVVFIIVFAYMFVKYLKMNNYWYKVLVLYVPTLLLTVLYVWLTGLREPLASSTYKDIFQKLYYELWGFQ